MSRKKTTWKKAAKPAKAPKKAAAKKKTTKKGVSNRVSKTHSTRKKSSRVAKKGTVTGKAAKQFPLRTARGMHDVLPQEQKYWEYVIETAKLVLRGWDFQRVDTPIVEDTALFTQSIGEESDIVSKELFELKSRGSKSRYSLRPEGTAPIVRSYIEHGMRSWPKPVKLFYVGPFFRYDRPQAGRYRQMHQFGMELFGSRSASSEAQMIYVAHVLFQQLGLEDYIFRINSFGAPDDRKEYLKVLKEHLRRNRSKLSRESRDRITSNPLRILDSKDEKDQQVANTAPKLVDHLSEDTKKYFDTVLGLLDGLEVPYEVAPGLVRGLDYYTGTVWEIVPTVAQEGDGGSQDSLAGGGRYDGLVKSLGGKDTAAIGMAFGVERIIARLKDEGVELTLTDGPQIFVAQLSDAAKLQSLKVMRMLQEADIRFAESINRDGMEPQLRLADRLGVKWVVVIGQKEVIDNTAILRNMESGMQEVVDIDDLVDELNKRLDASGAS